MALRENVVTRRALVLGAGGNAAIAWELGIIAGLSDTGVEVCGADVFIGTSAGAVVAAQIIGGVALEELFARQVDSTKQALEPMPPVDNIDCRLPGVGIRASAARTPTTSYGTPTITILRPAMAGSR